MTDLEGRVIIVTGASSGIGYRTVERFAEAGGLVIAVARTAEPLRTLESLYPERVAAVPGDLSDSGFVDELFRASSERFGPCEILVNNAGAVVVKMITKMSVEDWDRVFAVNTRAVFLTCRRAIESMKSAGRGTVINVASISGVQGTTKFPATTAYAASKSAVIGFTEALAAEVAESGIRVNAISPGSVDTPMLRKANPMAKPAMTPDEIANVILFLASDQSRPINGQNLHIYGT